MNPVMEWLTDEDKSLLKVPMPIEDLNAACYAVYFISLLRRRRAPEHLENMILLATGNGWARMYFDEFIARVREPQDVIAHEGSLWLNDSRR